MQLWKRLTFYVFSYLFFADDFKSITYKADPTSAKSKEIPPYNGFGSEEDSLSNCVSLIPKPPKRDFIKFMEKDRWVEECRIMAIQLYLRRLFAGMVFNSLTHESNLWNNVTHEFHSTMRLN